ncbi:hypothetical protein AVEN_35175-1 [Araneus ventricosus]|uniref:PiggyBac transposable element-derived protein domain-containing protein n=1 Tax=Araneus ventricosus TaxID=182803 RepID=A0A4Y2GR32_ARAVE|nr:hypothetical protein AVEN_35175-1 [Araneus ventricosus]
MAVRRLTNMARYLTYDEEMKSLRTFLDTVSTNEESLFDVKEEIDDDEENNNHFSRERDAKSTTEAEMKAFIGLLYISGVHKLSHVNITDVWATDDTGIEIFRNTMSSKQFLFLLRCICFDDIHDRQSRNDIDKLAPIREFFEKFADNCQKCYNVGDYVTIDSKKYKRKIETRKRNGTPNKKAKTLYKRCGECPNKDNKTQYTCEKYQKYRCMEHMASVCRKYTN